MKKFLCTLTFACLIFLGGCGQSDMAAQLSSQLKDDVVDMTATTVSFVSGMGCSDINCMDASHHHDCPPDCGDYEHHHNCGLDCTETSHHHSGASTVNESGQHHVEVEQEEHHADLAVVTAVSFVSGMGCSDPNCTDASHHHDCSPDCGDYEHHHNCGLDCTETSHHHNGMSTVNESGQHHEEQHRGGNHH